MVDDYLVEACEYPVLVIEFSAMVRSCRTLFPKVLLVLSNSRTLFVWFGRLVYSLYVKAGTVSFRSIKLSEVLLTAFFGVDVFVWA